MWMIVLPGLLLADPSPEPPADTPKGPAPLLVRGRLEGNRLTALQTRVTQVLQQRVVAKQVGNQVVTETQVVTVPVMTTVRKDWDLAKAKITDARGKKVNLDELRKHLAGGAAVVVSADGKPIDKGYLARLKKSAVVVVAPPAGPAPIGPIEKGEKLPAEKVPVERPVPESGGP